jgi:hypothetical protein
MTAPLPAFLACLPEPMRTALIAQAAADHAANPGPPLSPATLEALRVLLRRPTPTSRKAVA